MADPLNRPGMSAESGRTGAVQTDTVGGAAERVLSVPKFRVISRTPDLQRCAVSHTMSSGFILKSMSFFEMMRWSVPAGSPVPPMARGATGDLRHRDTAGRAVCPLNPCQRYHIHGPRVGQGRAARRHHARV